MTMMKLMKLEVSVLNLEVEEQRASLKERRLAYTQRLDRFARRHLMNLEQQVLSLTLKFLIRPPSRGRLMIALEDK